jgi:prolipoprotein diacylglyceryltransferase
VVGEYLLLFILIRLLVLNLLVRGTQCHNPIEVTIVRSKELWVYYLIAYALCSLFVEFVTPDLHLWLLHSHITNKVIILFGLYGLIF